MNAFKSCLLAAAGCVLVAGAVVAFTPTPRTDAADHGDSPLLASDAGADMADVFFFLDPIDNTRVILAFDVRGFIAPGENENSAVFDPDIQYRLAFETTGDAFNDFNLEVSFAPKTGPKGPQTATIRIREDGRSFTAPTTMVTARPGEAAFMPVVTEDPNTGIRFFAGLTDDPFFFDIPAELKYRDLLRAGTDPVAAKAASYTTPGVDSFAGFNVLMIAASVPKTLLTPTSGSIIGGSGYTERRQRTKRSRNLGLRDKGSFIVLDRMGIPAINTVLIPFARKDEYNRGTTTLDAEGRFAADIIASLTALKTSETNIGVLANLAVLKGDILRLDLNVPNTGPQGGGTNPAAGFPNGRRPADDVIDVVVNLISNLEPFDAQGNLINRVDNVDANDKPFESSFPYFAKPHQPAGGGG